MKISPHSNQANEHPEPPIPSPPQNALRAAWPGRLWEGLGRGLGIAGVMDEARENDAAMLEWRTKALYILLLVVAVSGLPAYLSLFVNALQNERTTPLLWIYLAVYLALIGLTVLPRLDFHLRAWTFLLVTYLNAIASFARVGLAGSGRLYLLVLPIMATILIGSRAGYITLVLSLLVYAVFALFASLGLLQNWLTELTNPLAPGFWIEAGAALSVFLVSAIVLLERFYSLHLRTLAASRQQSIQLERTAAALREREERLALSEKRFRALIEKSTDGIALLGADGKILYISPSNERILGYPEAEVLGHMSFEWNHPDELPHIQEALGRLIQTPGGTVQFEYRMRHKDGTWHWFESTGTNLLDEPDVHAIIVNYRDITERKLEILARARADEEIRRQNEYLAALHETTLGIIGRLDTRELLEAIVERATRLVEASYGWLYLVTPAKDELEVQVGTGFFHQYIGTRLKRGEGLAGTVWEQGEALAIEEYQTWPGRSFHYEGDPVGPALGVPLKSGAEIIGVIGLTRAPRSVPFNRGELELMNRFAQLASIALDSARLHTSLQQELAGRVRAQEALQASEARFRAVFEGAGIGIAVADREAHVLELNPAGERMLGYSQEEFRELTDARFTHPDDYVLQAKLFSELMAGRRERFQIEKRYLRKDGRVIWGRVTDSLTRDAKGEPQFIIALMEDINEQKEAAQKLEEAYRTLEQRVAERTHELATLNAIAERRREVAEALRDILAALNSTRSLDEILMHIVTLARPLLGSDAIAIYRLEPEQNVLRIQASDGLEADYVSAMAIPVGIGAVGRAILQRQPVVLRDMRTINAEVRALPFDAEAVPSVTRTVAQFKTLVGIPLILQDEVYGALALYYYTPREFSEEVTRLASTFGHQAALAIENARLRAQAEQSVTITERGRLARELHDSVTQSLYSVTLYTEAAARWLSAGNVAQATEHLHEARETAQEALREMRLLIFELRPPALERYGLAGALQARLDAVETRGGIKAELQVLGEERLPHAIQEELYHLAQEALNNALKHARARQVRVVLRFDDAATYLEICDDGVGFELAAAERGGGFGLAGMRERAQRIGGQIEVTSAPGHGTQVRVQVPNEKIK